MSSAPWQKPFRGMQIDKAHPLSRGLVGCWVMNESTGDKLFDLSGNGNHGTNNGADWAPDGLDFVAANDDYISMSDSSTLDITGALTLLLIYKSSVLPGDDAGLISKSSDVQKYFGSTAQKVYEIGILNNIIYFSISSGTVQCNVNGDCSAWSEDGNTHRIIATWDGTTDANGMKIYVDGVLSYQGTSTITSIQTITSEFDIGGYGQTWNHNGNIASAKVYNRALSPSEVAYINREPYAMFQQPISPASLYYEAIAATDVYLTLSQNMSVSKLGQANTQGPVILSNTLATVDGGGANALAPITVNDLLGLIEVGQAQTDQNLVLTNSLLFTTGADAVAQSTLDISGVLSVLQAGVATSSADITLNEILTVLQATINEFDVDLSLSEILAILESGLANSEGNLALSELLNIANSGLSTSYGSLSLSEILTILQSTVNLFDVSISLSEVLSVLQSGLVTSGGSVSILNILSILSASQSTAGASVSFAKNLSMAQSTAEITNSYLTLAYDLALNTQSISTAASTLALAINSGISATVAVDFTGVLPLSQSLDLSAAGGATSQSGLSLNNILSISILAEALASAGISLNMVESVITNGTLVSITVTTPDGRTVIIGVEIRTVKVPADDRIITI